MNNGMKRRLTRNPKHSGGEEVMLDVGGQDATEAFEDVGHSDEAREILVGMLVGTLKRQVCSVLSLFSFLISFVLFSFSKLPKSHLTLFSHSPVIQPLRLRPNQQRARPPGPTRVSALDYMCSWLSVLRWRISGTRTSRASLSKSKRADLPLPDHEISVIVVMAVDCKQSRGGDSCARRAARV